MAQNVVLAIDNGTQSIRALLFDMQGNLLARSRVPIEPYFSEHPGWAELRWAARDEGVVHLDDLLLRRVRLGLLLRQGGEAYLPAIRTICQSELGWDDARWQAEAAAYRALWKAHYGLPERSTIPNWRAMIELDESPEEARHMLQWSGLFAGLLLVFVWLRRRRENGPA